MSAIYLSNDDTTGDYELRPTIVVPGVSAVVLQLVVFFQN